MMPHYDADQLERELRAAGLAPHGVAFHGCDSDGRISWAAGHPTAPEQATAQAVLAAHDPARRRREQAVRARRIAEIDVTIKAGTDSPAEIRERRRLEIEYRENGGSA